MNLNRIHHLAIIASDYGKSKEFYTQVLGFKIVHELLREERQSYKLDLRINEHESIELFSFPDVPPRQSHPEAAGLRHLAFSVPNATRVREELLTKGVPVEEMREDAVTGARLFFFRDPDGLPIEIQEAQN